MFALTTLFTVILSADHPAPQDPAQRGGLVAEFQIGGQRQTVSRDAVALFLARRHRNSKGGKETIQHLIEVILVRRAAQATGLMPTGAEVRAEVRRIETALKQDGRKLDDILDQFRLSRREFDAKTALGLAQRRLASKVLGIAPAKVTPQHLALWTKEQRNKVKIVTDPRQLAPGVLATVGDDAEVTKLDVGRVLFTKISKTSLEDAINRMVFVRCIAYQANRHGIELTAVELEVQYARNEQAFEANATNQGVSYEKWLEALGSSKQKEVQSETTSTKLLHSKLVRRRYPPGLLDKRLADNRAALMRRHGARRAMSQLFIRATNKPNKLLRRDFAAALQHITDLRETILDKIKKRTFALMAKIASEDQSTKNSGGKIGWQHQEYLPNSRDQRVPTEVLEVAFELKIGDVSEPIRTKQGYFLVWVFGLEPEPDQATIRTRLLSEMADRYNRELYEAAKIVIKVK